MVDIFGFGQTTFENAMKEYHFVYIKKSIYMFTTCIDSNREVAKAYLYRGAAKVFLKDPDGALSDLLVAQKKDPHNILLYRHFGRAYFLKNNFKLALFYYNKAIAADKKDSYCYAERAAVKVALDSLNAAIIDASTSIRLDSSYFDPYNTRGFCEYRLGQYKQAMEDLDRSLKLKPYIKAYTNRGLVYAAMNEHEKAIEDFSEAIEIGPNYPDTYYYRGFSYKAIRKEYEACTDFHKSLELGYKPAAEMLKQMMCL
jgi:tetratricopeptide (TPR) repeat protein